MKHVTDQRKRKRWLVPLALCLAVCLAMQPVGLSVVQAAEDDVSAFWAAAEAFWGDDGKEPAFWEAQDALWGNEEKDITGVMQAYQDAMNAYDAAEDDARNTDDIDAARPEVLRFIEEYYKAYDAVTAAFKDVEAKYNALSDEEKAEVQETYDGISKIYNGDGTDDDWGIEGAYIDVEKWNYGDNEFQYQNACESYGSACEALWGTSDAEGNIVILGAMKEYEEAVNTNGDVDAALKKVQECVSGVKDAKTLIDKFYDAMVEVYGKIPAGKKDDLEESYQNEIKNKEIFDLDHNESLSRINIWEYYNSNVEFGKAWDLFFKVTNDFQGNEQADITGVYPTYMAALKSGAEGLDALYEEVLAARAAVEEAYKTMTEKYQAETAAYEALTEDDRKAPYGDTTAEAMHKANKESYTGYGTETYKLIHEYEIPAPPQIEDILDADYSEATKEEVNKAVKDLEKLVATAEPGSFDTVDETTMEKVDKLETAYARENKITLAPSVIADDVKDFGSDAAPQVVGALMALQPAAETTIKLVVKSTATQPEESLKNAVAVDIDLVDGNGESLTKNAELKFPVTITISVPTALKNATKIGIKHGNKNITPKMADGKLIFAVTHFSDFVFYDAGSTDTPGTDTPGTDTPGTDTSGSGNDVSGNDPGSTDTPGTDTPGTTDRPGTDTPGTTDKPNNTNTPGTSGTSNSTTPVTNHHDSGVQSAEQAIAAAEKGSTVKIVTNDSVTLTSSVLKTLINNPTVSLYLEYTYNGKNYKVLIPAGKAFVVEGIEYYGPLYLYSLFPYDGREVNASTLEYTIVKGDTLSKIAKKNNTTVSELVKLNRIKNPNRIRAGQKIVLPANN